MFDFEETQLKLIYNTAGIQSITPLIHMMIARSAALAFTLSAALFTTNATAQETDGSPVASFVDQFLGDLEQELKTELIMLRENDPDVVVPSFKLTEWNNGKDDPIVNETFIHNPDLLNANKIGDEQAKRVELMKNNVTKTRSALHTARERIAKMEIELASVSAHIIASEYMERVTKEEGNKKIQLSKDASKNTRIQAEKQQEIKMEELVDDTKRAVQKKTEQYNQALHEVMMDAGAILNEQKHVIHEKKTVLQETADREALPQIVDFMADLLPGIAESAKNATLKQKKVQQRMSKLMLEIKNTQEEIKRLENGGGNAATGGAAMAATTRSGASDDATGGR
jgi:hypothetical protein